MSQPHAPGDTVHWTTYAYDGLGRTTSVTLADGSVTTYVYDDLVPGTDAAASYVRVTDAAGKQKRYRMDALGRLTRVTEDPSGLALATNYSYDVLDHLVQVQQTRGTVTQTRTFNYVSGGHVTPFLQSATNPENGTVSYTYNTDGTLATKTDARNQQVSYAYDSYKRLTRINRGGGQNVALYYDTNPFDSQFTQNALGRLAAVQYQANSPHTFVEMYSYTAAGKLAGKQLQISYNCLWWNSGNGNPCNAAQVFALNGYGTYDNEGRMTAQTWPQDQAGRNPSVSYGYDAMGRPNTLTETQNGNQYNAVTGVTYNAANQPLSYGSETWTYNVLGQITSHQAGTWLSVQYGYATGQDNGKIASRTNVLSGEQVVYTYDSLNRLIQAQTAPNANVPQWGQGFVYDGFGNLLQKNVTAGSAPTLTVTVDSGNHVIASGMTYDAAGNPTQMYLDPGYSSTPAPLSWDADSRLVGVGSGGPSGSNLDLYGYDAGNHRVWHRNWLSDMFFFYGVDGHRIGTYTWDGTDTLLTLERSAGPEIYFRGRLQSTYAAQDQVGSTGGGGSYPYGESYASPDPGRMVGFATYTRDQTGLDYAWNRYYSSTLGRFLSSDPYQANNGGPGDPKNPQSWNRYAYVLNDPANNSDPAGLYVQDCDWDGCAFNPWAAAAAFTSGNLGAYTVGGITLVGPLAAQEAIEERQFDTRVRTTIAALISLSTPGNPPPNPNCLGYALGQCESLPGDMYINFNDPYWPMMYLGDFVGCNQIGEDATVDPQDDRKIVMFVDPTNPNNWHAMLQQQNGNWTSKNGEAPPVTDIPDPVAYYDQEFNPPEAPLTTYWDCSIPLE